MAKRICSEPDCGESVRARGWCRKHYNQAYHGANRDETNEHRRARYKANPEKDNARRRAAHKADPGKCRVRARARYKANPEPMKAWGRARRKANPEKIKAATLAYYNANPDKMKAAARNSHARRKGAGGDGVTKAEWASLVEATGGRCLYCGKRPKKWHMDHIIPLVPKPGDPQGQNTFENVVPACSSCNGSKYNYTLAEWWGDRGVRALQATIRRVHRAALALLKDKAA